MFNKERELVELGPHSYNLKEGGTGMDSKMAKDNRLKTNCILQEKYGENWRSIVGHKGGFATKSKQLGIFNPLHRNIVRVAQLQTNDVMRKKKETFNKIGHSKGEKNSQFGTMWITNRFRESKS